MQSLYDIRNKIYLLLQKVTLKSTDRLTVTISAGHERGLEFHHFIHGRVLVWLIQVTIRCKLDVDLTAEQILLPQNSELRAYLADERTRETGIVLIGITITLSTFSFVLLVSPNPRIWHHGVIESRPAGPRDRYVYVRTLVHQDASSCEYTLKYTISTDLVHRAFIKALAAHRACCVFPSNDSQHLQSEVIHRTYLQGQGRVGGKYVNTVYLEIVLIELLSHC